MSEITEGPTGLNRRQVLRIVAVGGAIGVAWKLGLPRAANARPVTETRTLMGTTVNLTVVGPDRDASRAAVRDTLARMSALEGRLTRYRDDSEVGRLNATGTLHEAGDDLLALLRLGRELHERGDGAFDLSVQPLLDLYRDHLAEHHALPPAGAIAERRALVDARAIRVDGRTVSFDRPGMAITLDGIGKGYVVDRAIDELRAHGFQDVMVEAGGDLVAAGHRDREHPWRLGIRRPRPAMKKMLRITASDRAVATSGDYMQPFASDFSVHHILDPRTGTSAPELASSTIVAPNAALADGLATTTMVLGAARGRALIEEMEDCEGCFIGKDLAITKTSGFRTI